MKVYVTNIQTADDERIDFQISADDINIKTPDDIPAVLQELIEKVMIVSMETTRDWAKEVMTKKAEKWVELQSLALRGEGLPPGRIRDFLYEVPVLDEEEATIDA